jgi:radical SAM protein with 4Fe4S-binding SPASM domain
VGIEADGTIKGCPSLPTTDYSGGNIRDLTAEQIWSSTPELSFTRNRTVDDLWGYCRSCYYADVCRAGCSWTTHTLFGRPGNNPFCHHRALDLAAQGLRERIVRVEAPPGLPFDYGKFEIVVENVNDPIPGQAPEFASARSASQSPRAGGFAPIRNDLVVLTSAVKPKKSGSEIEGRPSNVDVGRKGVAVARQGQNLKLCRGCNRYITRGTTSCPHCGGDVRQFQLAYSKELRRARRAEKRLAELMNI